MIGHILLLKWFVIGFFKPQNNFFSKQIKKKFFSLTSGSTKDSHRKFIDHLKKRGLQIEEVDTSEESEFIILFCPVVSRAGTDIEAALKKLNDDADTKPAIVVVLHYTFDPECIVPESHRVVNRKNTLTVDCLFHEEQGLLRCQKNEDSLNQVANNIKSLLKPKDLFEEQSEDTTRFISLDIFDENLARISRDNACSTTSSEQSEDTTRFISTDIFIEPSASTDKDTPDYTTSSEYFKHQFFSLTSGNTKDSHRNFIDHLMRKRLQIEEVDTPQPSDFIMFFCPVVSRAGTDIEAALRKLNNVADTKPAILVVLHYTFNPECIVPESHRVVNRENTFTVDCLFHEDQGLLRCQKNEDSLNQVANYIKSLPKPKDLLYKQPMDTTLLKSSDLFLEHSASIDKDRTRSTTSSENTERRCMGNNYLILLSDNRMISHETFLKHLTKQIPNIYAVNPAEEFHFVLVFCQVVSRAGTDIQAALHKLNEISGTSSAILVVFHYTFDPECIVPESHRVVNRKNTFTVDCLFHEDLGLLKCQKNEDSLNQVVNKIKSWLRPEDVINDQTAEEDPYFSILSENQENAVQNEEKESTPAENQKKTDKNEKNDISSPAEKVEKTDKNNNNKIPSSKSPENQQNADKNEKKEISTPVGSPKIKKKEK